MQVSSSWVQVCSFPLQLGPSLVHTSQLSGYPAGREQGSSKRCRSLWAMTRIQTGMAWGALNKKVWRLPGYSRAGQWPLNRDLSEARQGCHGAESKAAFWGGTESKSDQGPSLCNYKAGNWDATPPDEAWGPC